MISVTSKDFVKATFSLRNPNLQMSLLYERDLFLHFFSGLLFSKCQSDFI